MPGSQNLGKVGILACECLLPSGMSSNSPASMASRVAMRFPCPSAPVFNIPVLFLCWAAVLETEGQAFLGKARVGAVCVAKLEPQFPAREVLFTHALVIVMGCCFFISCNLKFLIGKYQMKFKLMFDCGAYCVFTL